MLKRSLIVVVFLSLVLLNVGDALAVSASKLDLRIKEAREVLEEMQEMPDQSIPKDLIENCAGIAIFPSVIKGGFIIGGQYGQGVLLNKDKKTGKWSPPVFVSIGGASFGFQIGGRASDMILVIGGRRSVESLSHSNVTLGGDASVAAGPVGRDASVDTDVLLKAGILSYSRSRGLFAGISLKGAIVGPMKNLNEKYYGKGTTADDILFSGKVKPTKAGRELIGFLNKY
ncbi:MAG: lipid-binding SYLF domain-containing protein [Candidatus Omnitrophota bacterium]